MINEKRERDTEVFTAVTVKNGVFWDIQTQFVPHRKHYVSATESSQLMLRKIGGFHGGDYEECRLLGYKTVRTLQETHYTTSTEHSQLMVCKIEVFTVVNMKNAVFWGDTMWPLLESAFERNAASYPRIRHSLSARRC
jgi:hypothetical protein